MRDASSSENPAETRVAGDTQGRFHGVLAGDFVPFAKHCLDERDEDSAVRDVLAQDGPLKVID